MGDSPQGVVAVLIAPDGHVIASVNDFTIGGAAGFEQYDTQKIRAQRQLSLMVLQETCAPYIAKAVDSYQADRIMDSLCHNQGFRVEVIAIGYDNES